MREKFLVTKSEVDLWMVNVWKKRERKKRKILQRNY